MDKNVSVIISSYNRSHVLKKTIPTFIQDVTLEVIIVDDGSGDDTRARVSELRKKYDTIKYIRLREHKGLPFAKNVGVRKARGKYIFFGDDDSVLYDGTLHRLRDAIEQYPADIAGANGSYATNMGQIRNMDRYISKIHVNPFDTKCMADLNTGVFSFDYKIDEITEGLYVMASFMIKAELAKTMRFDVGYIGNAAREDMDYLVRQAKWGRKMVYVPFTYEIDLPKSYVKGGGCHDLKLWKHCLFILRNDDRFINRHYHFLKERGYIMVSKRRVKRNYRSAVLNALCYYYCPILYRLIKLTKTLHDKLC